jgi:hypothetical protein
LIRFVLHLIAFEQEELTLAASIADTQEEKSKSKVDNVNHQMPLVNNDRHPYSGQ